MDRLWPLVVWTAMLGWSVAVFAVLRNDYESFLYLRGDLGNMTQAVWSTVHGRPLEMTTAAGEQMSRLAFHVDPILVLFAPLWLLMPSPLLLAGTQVVLSALGALPVFWLGRRHLGSESVAALLALTYLVYPWTAWNVLDAMHPVTLAMPLLLFAIWFLDDDRLVAFAACGVLIVLCGELMGLLVATLGVWYWLARGRRAGVVIAAAGFAWSALAVKVVIPFFADGPSVYHAYFESVGGSPEAVLRTALTEPGTIVAAITSRPDLAYVIALAAPLIALPALAPGLVAVASPAIGANLLSDRLSSTDPRAHYTSVVIALLAAATVLGMARLPRRHRLATAAGVLTLSVLGTVLMGPPGARGNHQRLLTDRELQARADTLRAAVALVPPDAPVSATNAAGSHLSARRYFYQPPVVGRANWIVVEEKDAALPAIPVGYWAPGELSRFVESIRANARWQLAFERDGVLVFRKRSAHDAG